MGEKNHFYGKHHSAEHIARLRVNNPSSRPEVGAKIAEAQRGRKKMIDLNGRDRRVKMEDIEITKALPKAESKVWHAHPVWFLEGNPIVGYSKLKDSVRLMFWSGQSFEEEGLAKEGTFKAAEARYTSVSDVKKGDLRRWLKKSKTIQWDYKNIVKRKGKLVRIT
jgi:hypothetical protein